LSSPPTPLRVRHPCRSPGPASGLPPLVPRSGPPTARPGQTLRFRRRPAPAPLAGARPRPPVPAAFPALRYGKSWLSSRRASARRFRGRYRSPAASSRSNGRRIFPLWVSRFAGFAGSLPLPRRGAKAPRLSLNDGFHPSFGKVITEIKPPHPPAAWLITKKSPPPTSGIVEKRPRSPQVASTWVCDSGYNSGVETAVRRPCRRPIFSRKPPSPTTGE